MESWNNVREKAAEIDRLSYSFNSGGYAPMWLDVMASGSWYDNEQVVNNKECLENCDVAHPGSELY